MPIKDLWIRYWLGAGGIDPDKDIELLTVPSTETLQGMRNGSMEAFSTVIPGRFRIVADNIGYIAALTAEIWPVHPEEFLAVRADWVDKHPQATNRPAQGTDRGAAVGRQAREQDGARPDASAPGPTSTRRFPCLSRPSRPSNKLGAGPEDLQTIPSLVPLYWNSDRGVISYPYKSLQSLVPGGSIRLEVPPPDSSIPIAQAKALVDKVVREDLWRQAAIEVGVPAADIPSGSSRGKETFFDGIVLLIRRIPKAYLDSLKIKALSLPAAGRLQPRQSSYPYGHGSVGLGFWGGDGEQAVAVTGLEAGALKRNGELEAALQEAVVELAVRGVACLASLLWACWSVATVRGRSLGFALGADHQGAVAA